MITKPQIHCFKRLKCRHATPEDFSNLPPQQRRKKLPNKVNDLNKEIQMEVRQRDGITKMKNDCLKNPQILQSVWVTDNKSQAKI